MSFLGSWSIGVVLSKNSRCARASGVPPHLSPSCLSLCLITSAWYTSSSPSADSHAPLAADTSMAAASLSHLASSSFFLSSISMPSLSSGAGVGVGEGEDVSFSWSMAGSGDSDVPALFTLGGLSMGVSGVLEGTEGVGGAERAGTGGGALKAVGGIFLGGERDDDAGFAFSSSLVSWSCSASSSSMSDGSSNHRRLMLPDGCGRFLASSAVRFLSSVSPSRTMSFIVPARCFKALMYVPSRPTAGAACCCCCCWVVPVRTMW
mmetsp:Transcript_46902/g.116899  ORF Transcript_46902/g.116899 Transcript_46902/m.116899 type:complete len:263 (+) Transcript_46902:387-1175(+)